MADATTSRVRLRARERLGRSGAAAVGGAASAAPALRHVDRSPMPLASATARRFTPDAPAHAPAQAITWHQPSRRARPERRSEGAARGRPFAFVEPSGRREDLVEHPLLRVVLDVGADA